MSITSDNTKIATVSADKTIKLWGLDFGDCQRSILAHQESVMSCSFVWGTHYLFTVGKDKMLKYWDCDKFENITKLDGHHGEIWALAVGKYGNVVITGSNDRSIRIWLKTDEALFLEEEREKEMQEMIDSQMDLDDETNIPLRPEGEDEREEDDVNIQKATRATIESLKAGEKIIDSLEVYEEVI